MIRLSTDEDDMSPTQTAKTDAAQSGLPVSRLADELHNAQYEPLLPIEKKLIGYSLGIGIVLLGVLVWTSRTFFDPQPPQKVPAGAAQK